MKLLPLGLVALLTLGLALPATAVAERPFADASTKGDAPMKERSVAVRGPPRGYEVAFKLEGTGVDRENQTYTISATGLGKAVARRHDGNVSALRADLLVFGKVVDANGTVVKEGRFRLILVAREHEDGNWTWHAASLARLPDAMPRILMRGTSPGPGGDTLPLEGHGRAALRTEDGPLRIRFELTAKLEKI